MSQLQALLNGTNHLEAVDLSGWGGPAEVLVRPLSGWEAASVERTMLRGMSAEVKADEPVTSARPLVTDLGELMESQKLARVQTVEYGLSHSGETCTPEQAAQLPSTWVDALYQAICRISGMESAEDSFRGSSGVDGTGEDGGDGDAAAEPERDTADAEPARVDAASAPSAS